jgi:hypothetical protein
MRIKAPGLLEDIIDELHEWFVVWYDETGHYDVFPAKKLGGSILIATGQTVTPQEYLIEKQRKDKEKKKVKKRAKVKKKAVGWRMPETATLPCLKEANDDFIKNWSFRDEDDNPEQKEYLDIITDRLAYELQLEIREIVDDLMRAELVLLNKALAADEKVKVKKKKKKKAKKGNH